MIVLGIDPGITRVGYGLVQVESGKTKLVTAGIIKVPRSAEKADLLKYIRKGISALCKDYRPDVAAIEKLFFAKNRKTALDVAEARGVILMSVQEAGIDIEEYSPNEVKMAVTGYGGADKKSVLKMIRLILREPNLKLIDDASDALAIALTSVQNLRI